MPQLRSCLLSFGALVVSCAAIQAQNPQEMIQRIVDAEYAASQSDHSQWVYLEETRKARHHDVLWVAQTDEGEVQRLIEEDERPVSISKQQELIQHFMQDREAQRKQLAEINHDRQQLISLLKLLPSGFVWTQTGSSATERCFHFEPSPHFHPPTREARVFSGMAGDLVADNLQNRIISIRGHLIHDVTFGGGLLGKLRQGGFFSIEQDQVEPSLWQLKAVHLHLYGNALLFKSVALEEDDDRSNFELQQSGLTLEKGADMVMRESDSPQSQQPVASSRK